MISITGNIFTILFSIVYAIIKIYIETLYSRAVLSVACQPFMLFEGILKALFLGNNFTLQGSLNSFGKAYSTVFTALLYTVYL